MEILNIGNIDVSRTPERKKRLLIFHSGVSPPI